MLYEVITVFCTGCGSAGFSAMGLGAARAGAGRCGTWTALAFAPWSASLTWKNVITSYSIHYTKLYDSFFQVRDALHAARARALHVPHLPAPAAMASKPVAEKPALPHPVHQPKKNGAPAGEGGGFQRF